jgi:hypothetical protein
MTDITDITWSMLSDAGINTDCVHRQPTDTGEDEYVMITGDTKVAFGPSVDVDGDGSVYGWDIAYYHLQHEPDGDSWWVDHQHEWTETAANAVRIVAQEYKLA